MVAVDVAMTGRTSLSRNPSASYDLVGFIFTNRCNFTCLHCCNESDSHKTAAMNVDEICQAIDDAAQCKNIREIGLSGGEPFLFQTVLSSVLRHAQKRGFPSQVTTNAFWARSEAKANALLSKLRMDGLQGLNISTSQYHLQFIRPERLRFAAGAAVNLGLVTRINYVTTRSFQLDDSRHIFGPLADHLEFKAMPCIPTGRAAEQVDPNDLQLHSGVPIGSCERFFKSLAIDFNADAYPCCSPGGFTPPLRLGNVRETSIGGILDTLDDNLLIQILSALGPAYFAPFIEDKLGSKSIAGPFVDQCHFCHSMMTNQSMVEVIRATVAQLESDLSKLTWDLTTLLRHTAMDPAI